MGVRLENSPHLWRLMDPADQARYGVVPGTLSCVRDDAPKCLPKRSPKRDADERKQQGEFASWLSLQRSKGRKIPYCWHATNSRSKATSGTPDFWVGINGSGIWFEFKKDDTCKLTTEQEEFRDGCAAQRIEWHLVHTAQQAIDVVEQAAAVRTTVSF
jgi:hypothetical protein